MSNAVGYYNYKKIIDLFQEISNKHEQINSFGFGDVKQLNYYVIERLKVDNENNLSPYYPFMFVVPQPCSSNGREMVYNFNILVMDILNVKDYENELDVWSDTLDILKDIVSQLKYSLDECYTNWDLRMPIQFQPFSEQYDDYVSGWNCSVSLVVPDALDRCIAPYDDFNPCIDNQ